MLPMLHAPLPGGEVPVRAFEPPLPLPQQRAVWHAAWEVARDFWQAAAGDERISAGFRAVCAKHAWRLSSAAEHA
ncbi:MAG: DNA-binding protein, partial [Comamonas sp.]